MVDHSITNLRAVYITNQAYQYPIPWLQKGTSSNVAQPQSYGPAINTGWHILPNLLWGHLANPRQWWEMVIKFEAISVTGISTKLFNPVPIQTAMSFQGQSTFPAFNNTVYAMTYTDDIYETPWFPWHDTVYPDGQNMYYEWNPAFKEGLVPKKRSDKFEIETAAAKSRVDLENTPHNYPIHFPTQQTRELPTMVQKNSYRRQLLPIYWYHMPYPQYRKEENVNAGWRGILSYFEEAWLDTSGAFWDPLNRPEHLGELRPGKNMISFSWEVHPSDANIWFNTDRLAFLPPYPRPRPIQPPTGTLNVKGVPQPVNPTTPGRPVTRYEHLIQMGLLTPGIAETVSEEVMVPETHIGLPNWRDFPVVPMRWFLKEIQQSNPWAYKNMQQIYYVEQTTGCPRPSQRHGKKGDSEIVGPSENVQFVGTEYEMYKYPPTQWFIKGVPLYDDKENPIPVEMQMFMLTTVHMKGKPRKSALYAPSWGPIQPQDLYSVNMDTGFGESYMRGRSGGARRTWYNPEEPRAERNPKLDNIYVFKGETDGTPTNFPQHPQTQCTIVPGNLGVPYPEWPRKGWLGENTRIKIKVKPDGKLGPREFEMGVGETGVIDDPPESVE